MSQSDLFGEDKDNFYIPPIVRKAKETGEGQRCTCCDQYVKVYKRSLNSVTCQQLIKLYRLGGSEKYIHSSHIATSTGTGDFSKARFFGLLKEQPNEKNKDKKTSGYWKLTPKGVDFIMNKIQIPKYVIVYNNRALGFDDEKTQDITDCLKSGNFSYYELMNH
jgi:predicted transcriptional regulator